MQTNTKFKKRNIKTMQHQIVKQQLLQKELAQKQRVKNERVGHQYRATFVSETSNSPISK